MVWSVLPSKFPYHLRYLRDIYDICKENRTSSITKAKSKAKVVFFKTYMELSGGNSPKKTPGAKPKEARTLAFFKSGNDGLVQKWWTGPNPAIWCFRFLWLWPLVEFLDVLTHWGGCVLLSEIDHKGVVPNWTFALEPRVPVNQTI